jgi:hypothetical protein
MRVFQQSAGCARSEPGELSASRVSDASSQAAAPSRYAGKDNPGTGIQSLRRRDTDLADDCLVARQKGSGTALNALHAPKTSSTRSDALLAAPSNAPYVCLPITIIGLTRRRCLPPAFVGDVPLRKWFAIYGVKAAAPMAHGAARSARGPLNSNGAGGTRTKWSCVSS